MLKITLVLNILLMLALTTGFTQAQDKPYIVNHVIIVGVDGMSPNGIQNANTPNMDFMMKNGSYSFHARAVLPSSSSSNWSSMIMGAGTEVHGITSNDGVPKIIHCRRLLRAWKKFSRQFLEF
jgi:predicted AlkP superfamily pyrophosphatase or phosphodiesterase